MSGSGGVSPFTAADPPAPGLRSHLAEPRPPSAAAVAAYLTNRGRDPAVQAELAAAAVELTVLERARLDRLAATRDARRGGWRSR